MKRLRYARMNFFFRYLSGGGMPTINSVIKRMFLLSCMLVVLLASGGETPVSAQTAPPPIYSPVPSSTLTSTTVTFAGGHHTPDLLHWVMVGSTPGGTDFYDGVPVVFHNMKPDELAGYTVFTVSGLPASGIIYVRYFTWTVGTPQLFQTHSYTMSVGSTGGRRLDSTNGEANGCNSDRFICIFPDATYSDGAAVRDNETGLVWERSPLETSQASWAGAITHCASREVGGRKGWSLPMREQLGTLVDPSRSNPALPTGHPFQLPASQSAIWSATPDTDNPTRGWSVSVDTGDLVSSIKASTNLHAWCTRGAQAYDGTGF